MTTTHYSRGMSRLTAGIEPVTSDGTDALWSEMSIRMLESILINTDQDWTGEERNAQQLTVGLCLPA